MNTKKTLIILLVLAVIGVIAWKGMQKTTPEENVPVEGQNESTSSITGAVKNANGDYEYKNETEFVLIEATFPSKTSLTGGADVKARTTMENWIKSRETEFLSQTQEILDVPEQERLRADGRKYALGMEYKEYTSEKYVSYPYMIYEDTGGAHPNVYYKTFTFDMNGNVVELADLFKDGSRYLDRLSSLSYGKVTLQLKDRFGADIDEGQADWVRMGTAPSPEALQFFYVSGNNLVLIFPPYQVAAYAAGVFEISIPFSELNDILK